MKRTVAGEEAMLELARGLAPALAAEMHGRSVLVLLEGDLGTGKSTLARGILRALGYPGRVPSPTYTLVEPYRLASGDWVQHLDLYRLADPEELEDLGWRDWAATPGLHLVEWPERAPELMQYGDLKIQIEHAGEARRVELEPLSACGGRILAAIGSLRQDKPE